MQDLLKDFDPLLSIQTTSTKIDPAKIQSKSNPSKIHSIKKSNHNSNQPLFSSLDLKQSDNSKFKIKDSASNSKFNSQIFTNVSKDDHPLRSLSPDSNLNQSIKSNLISQNFSSLNSQIRSNFRQEALEKHLAHQPFDPILPSLNISNHSNLSILTSNSELDQMTCLINHNQIKSISTSSQKSSSNDSISSNSQNQSIKIPTQLFHNHSLKQKNKNLINSSSKNPIQNQSNNNSNFNLNGFVDQDKLTLALDDHFNDLIVPSNSNLNSNSNSNSNSNQKNISSSHSISFNSPHSSPSTFDGPEGRPTPLHLIGLNSNSQLSVMDDELAEAIRLNLPPRLKIPSTWNLLYSIDQHGTSLETLYQKVGQQMSNHGSNSGCVLAIKDLEGNRFGAFVNEAFKPSKEYYGSGECFLWKAVMFEPDDFRIGVTVKSYFWTGINDYMVLSDHDLLSVGGGDGKFGLWIDSNLEKGISSKCPAFNNEILNSYQSSNSKSKKSPILQDDSAEKSFEIIALECWMIAV